MKRMTRRFRMTLGIVGLFTALSSAVASTSIQDVFVAARDGATVQDVKNCVIDCPQGEVIIGTCGDSQSCCGWGNCISGNNQLVCCHPGQICSNGLHTDPPSQPTCWSLP